MVTSGRRLGLEPRICRFEADRSDQVTFLLNSSMKNRAENRKYHYIYKITRFDGKYYLGMHSTDDLDDGYFGSGKLISRSIKKHGLEKHSKEILEFLDSRASLKEREIELVTEEIIDDPLCMNLMIGGHGGWAGNPNSLVELRNPEVRKRAGEKALKTITARRQDPAYREAYSQKISTALKGKQSWLGKKHSEETKERLKIALKGLQAGEKNSSFGTCWVVKENVKPFKIKKEQLEEYLANGYSRGRKSGV